MEWSVFGLIKTAAICLIILQTECTEFQNVENSIHFNKTTISIPHEELEHKGEKLRHMKLEVKQPTIK